MLFVVASSFVFLSTELINASRKISNVKPRLFGRSTLRNSSKLYLEIGDHKNCLNLHSKSFPLDCLFANLLATAFSLTRGARSERSFSLASITKLHLTLLFSRLSRLNVSTKGLRRTNFDLNKNENRFPWGKK